MNILVVEDDGDIGAMLSRGLSAEGFDVEVATAPRPRSTPPAPTTRARSCSTSCCRTARASTCAGPCGGRATRGHPVPQRQGRGGGPGQRGPRRRGRRLYREAVRVRRAGGAAARPSCTGSAAPPTTPERRAAGAGPRHPAGAVRRDPRAPHGAEARTCSPLLMATPNRPVPRGDIFDRLWASQGGASSSMWWTSMWATCATSSRR